MSADIDRERWQRVKRLLEEAIALDAAERSSFLERACAGDFELRREVESLLSSHEQAGTGFLKNPAVDLKAAAKASEPRAGRRIGVYQILEEIGRGGMGEVYRAVRADGQYTKEVAIKLVRSGGDSRSVLERFRNERQILASLDHPNIARLLDGGTDEDGAPYLVMELIAGARIDTYCDEHRLTITERLRLFANVCEAVQYAHQRLVIHRDIKPSNVLVTKEGTPKLLDFGIAKLLDPTTSEQTTMTQAMTPDYASPEQIRGEPITTASDVYSLGVVLYQLLTGRSPYPGDTRSPHELARAICDTEPGRPSTVVSKPQTRADSKNATDTEEASRRREGSPAKLQRRLAGDLDAILLMALRKEPARRYGSVEQFAEDIRRHLEGQPVRARKGSWTYRAEKFVRRHKVGMAAAVVVVLAIAGGVGATVREARIAQANARRAQKRFDDVRKLANSILFEVHDAIQHLAGSTPARELIVKRALEYLDSLSQEAGSDMSLRRELALAYEKVGNVQGAPNRDNLGNFPGALESFRKAVAIREGLVQAAPNDEQLQTELARDYGEIGDIVQAMGDLQHALESYRKGLAMLAAIPKPATKTRVETEILDVRYGNALANSGELDRAVETYRHAVLLTEELSRENPSDREVKRDQAITYISLGDGYSQMGQLEDALANYRASREIFTSLVTADNAQSRRDVGVAEQRLADALEGLGKYDEASVIRKKNVAEDLASVRADPANATARRDVCIDYYKLAHLQLRMGDIKNALANEHTAVDRMEMQVAANPSSALAKNDLQVGYLYLGELLKKNGRLRDSLQAYRKAREIADALTKTDPKDLDERATFLEVELNTAEAQLALGDSAKALAGYLDAKNGCEDLVRNNIANSNWRALLALSYEKLGEYSVLQAKKKPAASRKDWTEAQSWLAKSRGIWKDLQDKKQLPSEYSSKPKDLARQIAECESALAKL